MVVGGVDRQVAVALEQARRAWPGVELPEGRFAEEVTRRVHDAPDPAAAIASMHVADVYLAVGCASGDSAALSAFERTLVPEIHATLRRMGLSPTACDETAQVMRDELLVGVAGAPPRILSYAGSGPLRAWMRSVAARTGLRVAREQRFETPLHESLAASPEGDLELAYLRRTYSGPFKRAFGHALAALPPKDRLLLKQRLRHGMSLEDLAVLYDVHAATISRRVTDARERLVASTRDAMVRELNVGRAEVSSILRLIQSDLDITFVSAS